MTSWPILSVVTFLPLVGAAFIMVLSGETAASIAMRGLRRCGRPWSP